MERSSLCCRTRCPASPGTRPPAALDDPREASTGWAGGKVIPGPRDVPERTLPPPDRRTRCRRAKPPAGEPRFAAARLVGVGDDRPARGGQASGGAAGARSNTGDNGHVGSLQGCCLFVVPIVRPRLTTRAHEAPDHVRCPRRVPGMNGPRIGTPGTIRPGPWTVVLSPRRRRMGEHSDRSGCVGIGRVGRRQPGRAQRSPRSPASLRRSSL